MESLRRINLQKNFSRLFWIQALLNVNIVNLVITLFYVQRGLSLSQIFYLSIVWAIINLLFETPSSYMADLWGRKKTIIVGVVFSILSDIVMIFAHSFPLFVFSIALSAFSFACFTGTDEAIMYDTTRELGGENSSLHNLGKYFSARSLFKIGAPLVTAFIAQDLFDWQFVAVITLDIVATVVALGFAFFLVEPHHYMDVEEQEAGVMRDAWQLIRSDWDMTRAMLGRTVIFIAAFVIWRFHQEFFVSNGIAVVVLGVAWCIHALAMYVFNQRITKFVGTMNVGRFINVLNILATVSLGLMAVVVFTHSNIYAALVLFIVGAFFEQIRWTLYSEWYNKRSKSFNRATTLSLTNFIKSILDIPLLFIGSILVGLDMVYPFIFSFFLSLVAVVFFKIKNI